MVCVRAAACLLARVVDQHANTAVVAAEAFVIVIAVDFAVVVVVVRVVFVVVVFVAVVAAWPTRSSSIYWLQ